MSEAEDTTPEVGYLDGNAPKVINNDSIYLMLGLAVAIAMGWILDKSSTFKRFNAKNREPFWVLLLVLVSYGYLIPGLVEVLFSFNLVFDTGSGGFFGIGPGAGFNDAPPTTETMLGLVKLLWKTGSPLGAVLVVFYAIAIPVTKLLLLLVGNLIQKDLPTASRRCIQCVQNISKWACPDMFAYILLMHLVKSLARPPYLVANGRLDLGFTCFSLFCLGSTIAALGIRVPDREHGCFQQLGKVLTPKRLLLGVSVLFVLFAVPFFWGLNQTVMGLKVGKLDPMIEMTLSWVGLTREKLKSDVSVMNCLAGLALEISHGEVNSLIGFLMFSVFVIGMTLLDMLVLLWISIAAWRGRPATRWMQLSWVLKKLSMVDVTCMGVLIVTMCMAMYRQYVIVDMGFGQWLLVTSEVVHYITYYTVKGFTEVHEKLDLGNPMQGDEEEEETDLSSSASTSVEEDHAWL
ncbi:unnamed protein product [Symbiodinium pilosum]|uniref:Uncharacterized protein n=1 Tax=Symbiodinium pilosum TaxID=2952 RepID=A0A812W3Z9_SYMPI|nr:unnamed protein product [Symbiodinium pilosum]